MTHREEANAIVAACLRNNSSLEDCLAAGAIDDDQMTFNILAPGVMESHIAAGFTFERTKGRQFNLGVMYAPNVKQTGLNNFDPTQTVRFEMYQWAAEASYSWRF